MKDRNKRTKKWARRVLQPIRKAT